MVQCSGLTKTAIWQPLTQRQVQKHPRQPQTIHVLYVKPWNCTSMGNEQKQMLLCSDPLKRRQDDHKTAYFAAKGIILVAHLWRNWQT